MPELAGVSRMGYGSNKPITRGSYVEEPFSQPPRREAFPSADAAAVASRNEIYARQNAGAASAFDTGKMDEEDDDGRHRQAPLRSALLPLRR